jgi:hypothetical protein
VGGFNTFGNKLADFKTVDALCEGLMDFVGTHEETPVNRWL